MNAGHLTIRHHHDFGGRTANHKNYSISFFKCGSFIFNTFRNRQIHKLVFFDAVDNADMEAGLNQNPVHNRVAVFCIAEGRKGNAGTFSRRNSPALKLFTVAHKNLNQLILSFLTYRAGGKYILADWQRLV